MNIYFLADATSNAIGGFSVVLVFILFVVGVAILICWIAFPFIVLSKFNELLKETRHIARSLNETNKALQYLVDNARPERERV